MEYAFGKSLFGENYIMQDVWCLTRADSAPILLLTSAILKIESQEQTLASLGNVENFKEPLYLKCGEKETVAEKCSVLSEVDNWFHWFILLAANKLLSRKHFHDFSSCFHNQNSFSSEKEGKRKKRTRCISFTFKHLWQNILKFLIRERRLVWKVR